VDFRRNLQKAIRDDFPAFPDSNPFKVNAPECTVAIPDAEILRRWPKATASQLRGESLRELPIDHSVQPVKAKPGGYTAASKRLSTFLAQLLPNYSERRIYPQKETNSELSAYLHFGHLSAHEVFECLAKQEAWNPGRLSPVVRGSRSGFWGMTEGAEAWLDQVFVWRELGFQYCHYEPRFDRFETLPPWALKTLRDHAEDERPFIYDLEQFEDAQTHDPLWNAAQNQLRGSGRIHNYLRMLWGKIVLQNSASPQEAWRILIHLNNKYALDGRDPNSYSGIAWCFGRFDRPWGPLRPIFGNVRYMTSDSTRTKFKVKDYIERWTQPSPLD
jgi:deoxyribodipyrimidine photo-lyase